jgi:hypothetical protein
LTVSALRIYAETSPLAGSYVYTDWPRALFEPKWKDTDDS